MSNIVFNDYKTSLVLGTAGVTTGDNGNLHCAILTSGHTPVESDTWSSINSYIATDTAHSTAADQVVSNVSVATTTGAQATDDVVEITGETVTWSESTITGHYALVYIAGATTADNKLVCVYDFGADKSSQDGDFSIIWNGANSQNNNVGTILKVSQAST